MAELTKKDVQSELKIFLSSKEFIQKIEKIVRERIKNEKELEDKVVEINKNVISQLFKNLWLKKNTYINSLSNKSN